MRITGTAFDFSKKLTWDPAYIGPPGGFKGEGAAFAVCKNCKHFVKRDIDDGTATIKHPKFCGKVVALIGDLKKIDEEIKACEQFEANEKFQRRLERL